MIERRFLFWLAGAAWLAIAALLAMFAVGIGGGSPMPAFLLVAALAGGFAYVIGVRRSERGAWMAGLAGLVWVPLGGGLELLPVVLLSLLAGLWPRRPS